MVRKIAAVVTCCVVFQSGLRAVPAFPGAEGFGAVTAGGRGGQVIAVTNLNDAGAGSFRQALFTTGKRIIVFRVSGVIQLQSELQPEAENLSNFTVAGQTSPGGITITMTSGSPVFQYSNSRMHDEIWRFLRFRIPRASGGNGGDQSFGHYQVQNFIIDHCDFSGGDDEVFDIGYSRHFSVQWCTMNNSGPGGQAYGPLIAYTAPPQYPLGHISFHHNLLAHHNKRGPEFHWLWNPLPDSGKVDIRNNVNYNFYQIFTAIWGAGSFLQANLVGNFYKAGPDENQWGIPPVSIDTAVHVCVKGNYFQSPKKRNINWQTDPDTIVDIRYGHNPVLVSTEWVFPPVTMFTAAKAYDTVLARAGAWPRDAMNTRTVSEVRNGTGQISAPQTDPLIQSGPNPPADADSDGMPDFWETGMGLNPNSASDNTADPDGDGYTNIEEYINDVALARLCADYYNPVYPLPSTWPDYNPNCAKSLAVEEMDRGESSPPAIAVSPNPVRGRARFGWTRGSDPMRAAIYDTRGRLVARLSDRVWDASAVPNGVYVVRVKFGTGEFSKRLLVQK